MDLACPTPGTGARATRRGTCPGESPMKANIGAEKTMRLITCPEPGPPEALRPAIAPIPEPGQGEVLIRVMAAGVNRPDILGRKGLYPPPPGASPILGLEVAGEIAELGPAPADQGESPAPPWKIGDRVCALVPGGGYAEYCVTPASHCLPVPRGLSIAEAAGIPETFFTVWANVLDRGRLSAGERFLVHGGGSGIGTTAIQLARCLGAEVFATAGSDEKCRACLKLGASAAINYRTHDFVSEIRRLTEGAGVNLILDMVGGSYFSRNLQCLAIEGRLVQIAVQQGAEASFNLAQLMTRRLTATGSTLRPRSIAEKARIARGVRESAWPLLESGRIKVLVYREFPLENAADAHRLMESGLHIGKIILTVSGADTNREKPSQNSMPNPRV